MATKIDRRKHYVIVLDTETTNSMEEPLVYDFGWAVVDTHGTVYAQRSYLCRDIFEGERDLMRTAYYAEKIPMYEAQLEAGARKMLSFEYIRRVFLQDVKRFGIKEVCAHNARFDLRAVNTTQRWLSKSKYRYFFPYGMEIWDTMKMAESVILKMPTYRDFCEKHDYFTARGQLRKTAEILYQFISGDEDFSEEHTGLADVLIEKEILAYCYRQHKPMEKRLFPPREKPDPDGPYSVIWTF